MGSVSLVILQSTVLRAVEILQQLRGGDDDPPLVGAHQLVGGFAADPKYLRGL